MDHGVRPNSREALQQRLSIQGIGDERFSTKLPYEKVARRAPDKARNFVSTAYKFRDKHLPTHRWRQQL